MLIRALVYDALSYKDQSEVKGFKKLKPVITIVVYLNNKPWKGERELHSLMYDIRPEMKEYVVNTKLLVLGPYNIEDFSSLDKMLKALLLLIKYKNNEEKLVEIINTVEAFKALDIEASKLIVATTNLEEDKIIINEDGKVDMGDAFSRIKERTFNEGKERGLSQGLNQG